MEHTSAEEFRVFRVRLASPRPRCFKGRAVLIGDALHTIIPHTGWGLSMAMGDGLALAQIVAAGVKDSGSLQQLHSALGVFERQQGVFWEALLQQSLVAASHFGKLKLSLDRLVLSCLPTKLFLANYDALAAVKVEGRTVRPLRARYLTLALALVLAVGAAGIIGGLLA